MRRYIEWIVGHAALVIALTALVTVGLALQVKNLRVIVDPNTMVPQDHPYVAATALVEKIFGSKYVVVIGITPRAGDAFQPRVLERVERITHALPEVPHLIRGSLLSLSARRAKHIAGTADGLQVHPLMERVPQTTAQLEALRYNVRANPVYANAIVSKDERTAAIIAEFNDPGGFRQIVDRVRAITDRERDAGVEIAIGGGSVYTAQIERYSQRMAFLFPLALLIIGLIHYEAFRTLQGLILPLATALLAVVWALGFMGLAGVPMDTFNATTPILILAVAAGHAVQILKRYYEEFHRLTQSLIPAREANRAAVIEALVRVGPVMLIAGSIASLGFLSLIVFEITTIRTFGVLTALGIASALVLELTFIPALRSRLPAPGEREGRREQERRVWDRITAAIARWVVGPARWRIYALAAALAALAALGASRVVVENSFRSFFFASSPVQHDDRVLNAQLGGTNRLYVMIEGRADDAMLEPRLLRAMEATQRFLEQQPHVGKTISLVDFLKRMNRAMHGDDAAYERVPDSRALVSQYLLLYSLSGEPGDFDHYIDHGYRTALVRAFLRTDNTAYVRELISRLQGFLATQFGPEVTIKIGGNIPQQAALNEVMVYSKILNIVQIAAVIVLITSLVFRSLLAGLFVLVPLALAVLANFGVMGFTGIRLNVATAVISAMAVGIGADYAIYLIYRLREELAREPDEASAVRATLTSAGKASLFVASAVAGGYGVLLLSWGFYIHMWFAILIATAMLVSCLGALFILPSLVLSLRPRFVFARIGRLEGARQATVAVLLLGIGLLLPQAAQAEPAAQDIMEKNYAATRPQDSVSEGTFTLINKAGQERVRTIFTTFKLKPNGVESMRMVRFLTPPDVKGTATLTIEHAGRDDDIWIYVPALKKVRRLLAANKKDSYAGTDFSYGDIMGHKVEDWTYRIVGEETVDGARCHLIEALPRTEEVKANGGYSKRLLWVRQDNYVTVKGDFWDLGGQAYKRYRAADIQLVDRARAKWQPMQMEMVNVQTDYRTVIRFVQFKVNQQVKDDFFTVRYLERE